MTISDTDLSKAVSHVVLLAFTCQSLVAVVLATIGPAHAISIYDDASPFALATDHNVPSVAADAVDRGSNDSTMLALVQIDRDDIAAMRESLRVVVPEEADMFPPQSVRKWTYLQLKAAYELRDGLKDPLGVVEEVYADFEYPAGVASFVRYIPPPADAPVGEAALYDRWARYLIREAAELIPGDPRL